MVEPGATLFVAARLAIAPSYQFSQLASNTGHCATGRIPDGLGGGELAMKPTSIRSSSVDCLFMKGANCGETGLTGHDAYRLRYADSAKLSEAISVTKKGTE
jgi:hypothetical protein